MDPEIEAMQKVADALGAVDEGIRSRVLRWAAERYGVAMAPIRGGTGRVKDQAEAESGGRVEVDSEASGGFDAIADLFVAARPKTGPQKVLVASYWLQALQKSADVTSFAVNQELKHLGHQVNSINKVFDSLMEQKPQLAVQMKKGGNSQQARKRYKLTHAGIERVKSMISGDTQE